MYNKIKKTLRKIDVNFCQNTTIDISLNKLYLVIIHTGLQNIECPYIQTSD